MTKNERFKVKGFDEYDQVVWDTQFEESCSVEQVVNMLNDKDWIINMLNEENDQLRQSLLDLTTKDTGRIDLANGYSYNVKHMLKGVEKMNHDCENCHHYNSLIHHEEGVFYQCLLGNKLWEECNDFDAVKEVKK